jgi:hypothetical protein
MGCVYIGPRSSFCEFRIRFALLFLPSVWLLILGWWGVLVLVLVSGVLVLLLMARQLQFLLFSFFFFRLLFDIHSPSGSPQCQIVTPSLWPLC